MDGTNSANFFWTFKLPDDPNYNTRDLDQWEGRLRGFLTGTGKRGARGVNTLGPWADGLRLFVS